MISRPYLAWLNTTKSPGPRFLNRHGARQIKAYSPEKNKGDRLLPVTLIIFNTKDQGRPFPGQVRKAP